MNNTFFESILFPLEGKNKEEIELNNLITQNIINRPEDEQNYTSNLLYFNDNEYLDTIIFDDFSNENDIKSKNDNNENLLSYNEHILSGENEKNNFLGKKIFLKKEDKIIFKKNRNNLNNNIFTTLNDKNKLGNNNNDLTSETSSSNNNNENKITFFNVRTDTLLIKFKSFLGKSFIKHINNKLKNLTKRKIKFFSFNYKKFTLNVSYTENKKWLNEKMRNLMVLGGEPNQIKNEKALKSLYKKKEEEFNEVKNILELTYKDIIEKFYLSKYFEEFKKDEKVIKLDNNFSKIMNISLLTQNGFIYFLNTRKGNKEKQENNIDDFI